MERGAVVLVRIGTAERRRLVAATTQVANLLAEAATHRARALRVVDEEAAPLGGAGEERRSQEPLAHEDADESRGGPVDLPRVGRLPVPLHRRARVPVGGDGVGPAAVRHGRDRHRDRGEAFGRGHAQRVGDPLGSVELGGAEELVRGGGGSPVRDQVGGPLHPVNSSGSRPQTSLSTRSKPRTIARRITPSRLKPSRVTTC